MLVSLFYYLFIYFQSKSVWSLLIMNSLVYSYNLTVWQYDPIKDDIEEVLSGPPYLQISSSTFKESKSSKLFEKNKTNNNFEYFSNIFLIIYFGANGWAC